jgi:type II restriction enzyme
MRYLEAHRTRLGCDTPDAVFAYLMKTLKDSITPWDYFVDWARVLGHIESIEMDLHLLDYLVGKKDTEQALARLLREHPTVAQLVPVLIACRQCEFSILTSKLGEFRYQSFKFEKREVLTEQEIAQVVEFARSVGFLDMLRTERVKSVVDYAIGVEVGLDSNARKNRGGNMMESIVRSFLDNLCGRLGFPFISQANADKVKEAFGLCMKMAGSARAVDFAIRTGSGLCLLETNFYGGGGSKLKATAGEYQTMFGRWKEQRHTFVWLTDGKGWTTTERPLREAFDRIDYVLNLHMMAKGLLEDILLTPAGKPGK